MFVLHAMIIRKMRRLQAFSYRAQRFALIVANQVGMADIPAYLNAGVVKCIYKVNQILTVR